jgi:hypothetical protein
MTKNIAHFSISIYLNWDFGMRIYSLATLVRSECRIRQLVMDSSILIWLWSLRQPIPILSSAQVLKWSFLKSILGSDIPFYRVLCKIEQIGFGQFGP